MLVWGTSARHNPQNCGLSQVLHDEDVVQIVKKKVCRLNNFSTKELNNLYILLTRHISNMPLSLSFETTHEIFYCSHVL